MRDKKDVDAKLMIDMFSETLERMTKGGVIKIVLLSGDSDYAYCIEKLREKARIKGAKLLLYVISWKDALSKELADCAHRTLHIEDFLEQIDPVGHAALQAPCMLTTYAHKRT